LKVHHFSCDAEVIVAAYTVLDGQHTDFLSGLEKFEQQAKKLIELLWEYGE
jgi:hypothetical protein